MTSPLKSLPGISGLVCLFLAVCLLACDTPYDTIPPPDPGEIPSGVLVFTKVAGFRHASSKTGVQTLKEIGRERGWTVVHTENGAAFNSGFLSRFRAVVWLNTTWDVLNEAQQEAFRSYIESGGGFVGVHAAADTEYDWEWYRQLVGTRFANHPNFPNVRNADVVVENDDHPATAMLPERWNRDDEWYNFDQNPRHNPNITVLATVDERTYDAGEGAMGDHPIIWYQTIGEGRSFYTGLGHTPSSYADPLFRQHLTAAIEWAGRINSTAATNQNP
jgi:type 1 glutamine amidotransferase